MVSLLALVVAAGSASSIVQPVKVTNTVPVTVSSGSVTAAVTSAAQDPGYIAPASTSAPSKALVVMGKSADGTPAYNPLPLAAGSGSVVVSGTVTTSPPANASTNIAQVAGATVSTAASGVQKVGVVGGAGTSLETTAGVLDHNAKNIANAAIATAASGVQKVGVVGNAGAAFDGATAGAVPANAVYVGTNENGNTRGIIQCDKIARADIATATTTSLIAVSGATTIYVCGYTIEIQGVVTTAGTMILEYGTGAACTSPVTITPTWTGSTTAGNPTIITRGGNLGYVSKTIASQGLCALSTSTTPQRVEVSYAQF